MIEGVLVSDFLFMNNSIAQCERNVELIEDLEDLNSKVYQKLYQIAYIFFQI